MYNYTFKETLKDCIITYRRVNKKDAKKLFLEGKPITFTPVYTSPASPVYRVSITMELAYKEDNRQSDIDYWEMLVNRYTIYNCNSELGPYVAFYTNEKEDI